MKVCPKCRTQYADATLSFCLDDGTPLIWAGETDTPTAVLTDTELVTSVRSSGAGPNPRFMDSQVTQVSSLGHAPPAKSRTGLAVILTAVGMVVLFGIFGVVGYLVFLNSDRPIISNVEPNKNGTTPNVSNANANSSLTMTPGIAPSPTVPARESTPTVSPIPPPIDESAIKSEVSKEVYGWKSALESRDLNSYMGNYAGTLDYYTKRGVSIGTVRADKARALALYSSMQVGISNMSVSTSPSGDTATAVFDKAWTFSGNGTSSGKVRSQLIYRRINGRWLITSERDLKVYYTR